MRQICNVITFYDLELEKADLKGWYNYCVKWFEEKGFPPGSIGLTGKKKLLQFKNGNRQLEKKGFEEIVDISLHGGVSELGTTSDWRLEASFDLDNKVFYLCFDEAIFSFTSSHIFSLTWALMHFCPFQYGIAYQRPFNKGPSWYAVGVIGSEGRVKIPEEESNKIGEWMRIYPSRGRKKYKLGLLRDVYPFNFLTQPHLDQKIGNQTLKHWIDSDSSHGTLDSLSPTQWIWSVPEEHIPSIQEVLQEAGLLLCYTV